MWSVLVKLLFIKKFFFNQLELGLPRIRKYRVKTSLLDRFSGIKWVSTTYTAKKINSRCFLQGVVTINIWLSSLDAKIIKIQSARRECVSETTLAQVSLQMKNDHTPAAPPSSSSDWWRPSSFCQSICHRSSASSWRWGFGVMVW